MRKQTGAKSERLGIAELAFGGLAILVPLAFWPRLAAPTTAKLPIITILVGLILMAVSVSAAVGRRLPSSPILYPLLAGLLWKLISTAYGRHFYASAEPLAQAVVYTIVFIGVSMLLVRPGQAERLLAVTACAAIPVCVVGLFERFGLRLPGSLDIYDGRIYSTTGNPTFLAAYLGLLLPVQLSLFILAESRSRRWLFGLAASLSLLCVIWTYTRGIWAGLALALPAMLLVALDGPGRDILKRRSLSIISLILVLVLVAGIGWLIQPASSASRASAEATHIGPRRSDVLRRALIGAGFQMLRDHPLLGVGLGGYQVHYLEYIRTKPIPGNYWLGQDHAHNEFVEVAAEQGIPGLAIYIWFLSAIAVTVIRGLKRTRAAGDARTSLLIAGTTAGLIAFSADTMVNVSLHEVHIGVFYWLLLGLLSAMAVGAGEITTRPRPKPQRVLIAAFGLAGLVVLSSVGIKALLSDVYTYNASLAQKNADWESAGRNSEYALKHNPFSPIPLYWLGIAYREACYPEESLRALRLYQSRYPHSNRIDFELGRTSFSLGDYRSATGYYREAVRRDPADFPAWQGLAASLYLAGYKDEAHAAAARAVELGGNKDAARGYGVAVIPRSPGRLHYLIATEVVKAGLYEHAIAELELATKAEPRNPEFLTTLGAACWKIGRMPDAEVSLKAAVQVDPGSAQPHGYLGMVYLQTGRKAEARQEILRAISLSPDAQSRATYESLLRQLD